MRRRLMAWSALVVAVAIGTLALIARTSTHFDAGGSDHEVLRAGYALEAPWAYRDGRGTLRGEAVETLRAALQRAGMPEPMWIHMEFPRLLHELQSGRIDVIAAGMFITPERAALVDFTQPTTSVRTGLLVARATRSACTPWWICAARAPHRWRSWTARSNWNRHGRPD